MYFESNVHCKFFIAKNVHPEKYLAEDVAQDVKWLVKGCLIVMRMSVFLLVFVHQKLLTDMKENVSAWKYVEKVNV